MNKKTVQFFFAFLFAMALTAAMCPEPGSADTAALSKDEARDILKVIAPDVNVLSVEKSPVDGLWEVAVSGTGGIKGVVYLDSTKKFIIQGQIINLATKANITKEKFDEISKVDVSKIPFQDSLIVGDPEAKHKIFVFIDPDCPYCAKFDEEIKKVIEKRKDIAFYLKLFPLPMHPQAHDKSVAIGCEKDNGKAVKMLEDAYARKDIPKAACTTTTVDENMKLGESLGLNGTPTVIFADGMVKHYMPADDIMKMVDNQKL